MTIFHSIDDVTTDSPLAIALGTFDGIHIGHRRILEDAVSEAKRLGIKSACYCFSNIPKEYLSRLSGKQPGSLRRLCAEDEKMEILRSIGLDYVFSVPFDERTMSVSAEEFVRDTLIQKLHARVICCGFNYTFGRCAQGTTDLLRQIAAEYGAEVRVQPPVYTEGHLVSSTAIRTLLNNGDLKMAHKMLGR